MSKGYWTMEESGFLGFDIELSGIGKPFIQISDKMIIEKVYARRSLWRWLTGKPRQLVIFCVEKDNTAKSA